MAGQSADNSTDSRGYMWQLVMLVLSVWVLVAMAMELVVTVSQETSAILELANTLICYVFIGDFAVRFVHSANRKRFLLMNWIDLVASIPQVDALRWGR